ncbi:hypothetical protein GE061_002375 [Apolygus lucorum]|uniref:Uncharacterized protein n=1 Tax=Apolygus lucorum TaxID=248454 RepID=A0A8S9X8Y8_APOLU|nr:hypothetical protein GE061_002375 [Apolygus lucorum]
MTEKIVMTPKGKTSNSTTLVIERKAEVIEPGTNDVHVAGGDHQGIVINKTISNGVGHTTTNPRPNISAEKGFAIAIRNAGFYCLVQPSRAP